MPTTEQVKEYYKLRRQEHSTNALILAVCMGVGTLIILLCLLWPQRAGASEYTDTQIVNAIFVIEGGYKADYLYGIRSVSYKDEAEARQICFNTVRNNRKRFADYGHKEYPDFLSFLASRYAPLNVKNDPHNLNNHWLKNLKFILNKTHNE